MVWPLRHTQGLDEGSQAMPRPRFLHQGAPPVELACLSRRKGNATLIRDALLVFLELLSITDLSFAIGDELHQSLATFAGTNRINESYESGC